MESVQAVNRQLFILGPHYSAYAGGGGQQCGGRNLFAACRGWGRGRRRLFKAEVPAIFRMDERVSGADTGNDSAHATRKQ